MSTLAFKLIIGFDYMDLPPDALDKLSQPHPYDRTVGIIIASTVFGLVGLMLIAVFVELARESFRKRWVKKVFLRNKMVQFVRTVDAELRGA